MNGRPARCWSPAGPAWRVLRWPDMWWPATAFARSEEHTSELQSHVNLVCRLLLEKKKRPTNRLASPLRQVERMDRKPDRRHRQGSNRVSRPERQSPRDPHVASIGRAHV